MIVTYWILFIFFSFLGGAIFRRYILTHISIPELVIMVIAVIFAAIFAGALFGGLILF